jgi:hypothetical protein
MDNVSSQLERCVIKMQRVTSIETSYRSIGKTDSSSYHLAKNGTPQDCSNDLAEKNAHNIAQSLQLSSV